MLKTATIIGSLLAGGTAAGLVHLERQSEPQAVLEPMVERVRPDSIVLTKPLAAGSVFAWGRVQRSAASEGQASKRVARRAPPTLVPCSEWRNLGPKSLTTSGEGREHRVRSLCR